MAQTSIMSAGRLICIASLLAAVWAASSRVEPPKAGSAPPSEAEVSNDFRIISGSEVIVPVSVEAGQAIVNVSINGRGPFPMMFDTGAQDAVTPQTAALLGLKIEGSGTARDSGGDKLSIAFTRVAAIRLGDAEMTDQPFAVLPLPRDVIDRGNRPPLTGFIGYELLARFAVRLDYDGKKLMLTPTSDFRYDGKGVRVPLTLTGKAPILPASADGIPRYVSSRHRIVRSADVATRVRRGT